MAEKGGTNENKNVIIIVVIMIIIILLLAGWIYSNSIVVNFATPDDLKLTISTEKEIINKTKNKSLMVSIKLTNVVDENLFVLNDFSINGLLEFKITIPSNNTIFPRHPHINLTSKIKDTDYITLFPDDYIDIILDIFDYEYSVGQNGNDTNLYDWNETGKYKIQFEYDNFQSDEIVKSNIIEFWLED
jgi:hypothetical protein